MSEMEAATHGRGDRAAYYDKWSKVASESAAEVEASESAERAAAADALGTERHPRSAAEAEAREKRAALKQAKAAWAQREADEANAKATISGLEGEALAVGDAQLAGRRVLVLADCRDCRFELPAALGEGEGKLIKVFVERCARCTLTVRCRLLTSFVELAHCEALTLEVRAVLHTVQADVCDGVWISYDAAAFDGAKVPGTDAEARVYHAGCRRLSVDAGRGRVTSADFIADGAVARGAAGADEEQFLTRASREGDALVTERVARSGERWLPEGEARARDAVAGAPELALADAEKARGNASFAAGEPAQAAVHYTLALEHGHATPAVIRSNRAACFLKLGEHEKALADADAAVALDGALVKGHFRRGLALHALGRYREALPSFGRALEIEPKNKQIKEAMKFAEYRLQQEMSKASGAA